MLRRAAMPAARGVRAALTASPAAQTGAAGWYAKLRERVLASNVHASIERVL
jgi:hypothetical protein